MAKAPEHGEQRRTKAQLEAELLHRLDLYVDSPTAAGTISSFITVGAYRQADEALERAQRAHESRKAQQERQSWQ